MDEMDSILDDLSENLDKFLACLVKEEDWINRLKQDEQLNKLEQSLETISNILKPEALQTMFRLFHHQL